jgi:hypothetical protein
VCVCVCVCVCLLQQRLSSSTQSHTIPHLPPDCPLRLLRRWESLGEVGRASQRIGQPSSLFHPFHDTSGCTALSWLFSRPKASTSPSHIPAPTFSRARPQRQCFRNRRPPIRSFRRVLATLMIYGRATRWSGWGDDGIANCDLDLGMRGGLWSGYGLSDARSTTACLRVGFVRANEYRTK